MACTGYRYICTHVGYSRLRATEVRALGAQGTREIVAVGGRWEMHYVSTVFSPVFTIVPFESAPMQARRRALWVTFDHRRSARAAAASTPQPCDR